MIDTHAHLYTSEFDADRSESVQRAIEAGVSQIFLPAIDSETHERVVLMQEQYAGVCYAMMGLHPCSVKENYKAEIAIVEKWLQQGNFYAIGETGLDFYWDKTFVNEQIESLHIHAELALQYDLPLILHTRNSMQETIEQLKKYKGTALKGIFHCFSGSTELANEIIKLGFLMGIGGVLTYKNAGLGDVLKNVSLDHLVLETDAPYLTPVPYRGKRNESAYIPIIAKHLAEVKQISLEEVINTTTQNAKQIFKKAYSDGATN